MPKRVSDSIIYTPENIKYIITQKKLKYKKELIKTFTY